MRNKYCIASLDDLNSLVFFFSKFNLEKEMDWKELISSNLEFDDTRVVVCKVDNDVAIASTLIDDGLENGVQKYSMYSFTTNEEITSIKNIIGYYDFLSSLMLKPNCFNYELVFNEEFFSKKVNNRVKLYIKWFQKIGFAATFKKSIRFRKKSPFVYNIYRFYINKPDMAELKDA